MALCFSGLAVKSQRVSLIKSSEGDSLPRPSVLCIHASVDLAWHFQRGLAESWKCFWELSDATPVYTPSACASVSGRGGGELRWGGGVPELQRRGV